MKRYCLISILSFLIATLFSFPAFSKTVNKFEGIWYGHVSVCNIPSTLILKINAQGKAVQDQVNGIAGNTLKLHSYSYGHAFNNGVLKVKIPRATPNTTAIVENGHISLYNHGTSMHFSLMAPCENNSVLNPNKQLVHVTTTLQKVNA